MFDGTADPSRTRKPLIPEHALVGVDDPAGRIVGDDGAAQDVPSRPYP